MRASISLGRWFGVPVGLHYSWLVVAWLVTLSLTGQFDEPSRSAPAVWALAILTAALFFICIVLHELAHASVARVTGVGVRGITLFALGGIAQIEKEAASPGNEFWMAIAGPAASLAIGLTCRAGATLVVPAHAGEFSALGAVLGWLAYINIALALFNLIPGFPLRATRIAARVGQGVAVLFIAGGLVSLFVQRNVGGLWIAFIGWFLLQGAQAYYLQVFRRHWTAFALPMSWRGSVRLSIPIPRCGGSWTSICFDSPLDASRSAAVVGYWVSSRPTR